MRIISKFKDYYDHQSHIYGQDEKVVFVRQNLAEANEYGYIPDLTFNVSQGFQCPYSGYMHKESHRNVDDWLVVCGKAFPLVQVDKGSYPYAWEVIHAEKHKDLVTPNRYRWDKDETYMQEMDSLIELSRLVGTPIFIINGMRWVEDKKIRKLAISVEGTAPLVGNMGLASIYPAEQIYQDLNYFITNKMQASPDVMPRSVQTDKEKISQHGFDLKQSFRHRV